MRTSSVLISVRAARAALLFPYARAAASSQPGNFDHGWGLEPRPELPGAPRSCRELHHWLNFVCARHLSRALSRLKGQGTVGDGLGLRPEDSNLTASVSGSCSAGRSIRYLSPLTELICYLIRSFARRLDQCVRHAHEGISLGDSAAAAWSIKSRRNRGLRHPAYFCFVSFAL